MYAVEVRGVVTAGIKVEEAEGEQAFDGDEGRPVNVIEVGRGAALLHPEEGPEIVEGHVFSARPRRSEKMVGGKEVSLVELVRDERGSTVVLAKLFGDVGVMGGNRAWEIFCGNPRSVPLAMRFLPEKGQEDLLGNRALTYRLARGHVAGDWLGTFAPGDALALSETTSVKVGDTDGVVEVLGKKYAIKTECRVVQVVVHDGRRLRILTEEQFHAALPVLEKHAVRSEERWEQAQARFARFHAEARE